MTLFANLTRSHRGPGRAWIAARRAEQDAERDAFAEHLSEHGNIARAARECGRSDSWGRAMFRRLCDELGSQAV